MKVEIGSATLYLGDCREMLTQLDSGSVDSIVTDPPYELGFMGKDWDRSGIANNVGMWAQCLRVLKPGGHLLAFSGSRTYHRMVCAIEDAGFEIRDQIMWLYGSGFPKSKNLGGEWEGWGSALKPAHEPIVVARKPLEGTLSANVLAFGTGALNIEGCRVPVLDANYARNCSGDRGHAGTRGADEEGATNLHAGGGSAASGRWPANVIHDGSPEILDAFAQFGERGASAPVHRRGSDKFRSTYGAFAGNEDEHGSTFHADTGTAARFFYCAKASRADRNHGFEDPGPIHKHGVTLRQMENAVRDGVAKGNTHPTVKPTDLMTYLCRLITPAGGVVLDPFMGSGSTGKAAMREGFRFIGIDMTPEYVEIARARIEYAQRQESLFESEAPKAEQMSLLGAGR